MLSACDYSHDVERLCGLFVLVFLANNIFPLAIFMIVGGLLYWIDRCVHSHASSHCM